MEKPVGRWIFALIEVTMDETDNLKTVFKSLSDIDMAVEGFPVPKQKGQGDFQFSCPSSFHPLAKG